MPFSEKLFISVEAQQFYWNYLFSGIHLQPWTFFFLNCNLYVMWLATINLMRPWGIVYKMKKKMFTLVLIGSARRLAHRIFFFAQNFFFHSCFIWNNELLFLPETGIDSRWTKPAPWGTQSSHVWGESLGTREDLSLVK